MRGPPTAHIAAPDSNPLDKFSGEVVRQACINEGIQVMANVLFPVHSEIRAQETTMIQLSKLDDAACDIASAVSDNFSIPCVLTKGLDASSHDVSISRVPGDLRSHGRMDYCTPVQNRPFSVRLELLPTIEDQPALNS